MRYLLLIAALLSPRPPALMMLDGPEASLHPELIKPPTRLKSHAAQSPRMVVVSHSAFLVGALAELSETCATMLEKQLVETVPPDATSSSWRWPTKR